MADNLKFKNVEDKVQHVEVVLKKLYTCIKKLSDWLIQTELMLDKPVNFQNCSDSEIKTKLCHQKVGFFNRFNDKLCYYK